VQLAVHGVDPNGFQPTFYFDLAQFSHIYYGNGVRRVGPQFGRRGRPREGKHSEQTGREQRKKTDITGGWDCQAEFGGGNMR